MVTAEQKELVVTDDGRRASPDDCGLIRWFLDLVEDAVEAALREARKCEHGGPSTPVPPGGVAAPVTVLASAVTPLIVASIGARYAAPGQPPPSKVIWRDGDSEVLVHLDKTETVMFPGLVLVALTLEADETGPGQLVVAFAVGSPDSPAGLVAVTEARPRGPEQLADRWGEAVTAAAWLALLDVTHGMALQSRTDTAGARLIPGAITCDGSVLSVTPQARHPADQVAGR
jgi:hypothetical protein